ncbi:anaerobic magnesium-protoporphyrin IX monomethyl ester cyclase [Carboxydocella thermautotrophica]|nr:anaerobic magnesium-protoporphyrin IX monomethyl ester cyclase [Carboxydocella thermautotrophica]
MKVLLITPSYHAGVVEAAGSWPNLGLVYLAGHLRAAGHEVVIYDAMTKGHDLAQIKARIEQERPRVVGTTSYTASAPAASQVLQVAKAVDPSILTVFGGIHANFMYEEMLKDWPWVDVVVRGEGEETLPELLDSWPDEKKLAQVKGIAWRNQRGEIIVNPARPFLPDLDRLIPAWDLVEWEDYTFYVLPGSRLGLVNSSRGCPHQCAFCSQQKFWQQSYRERSAESFVSELEHLKQTYGVNVVMLSDEYPTRNRERWEKILDLLLERQVGMYLLLETCVSDVLRDRDILDKYRAAGVIHVYVGVEATDQASLDQFKKSITCEQGREALALLNEANIISECSFVLGTPEETPEHIDQTLELAKHYNPDFAHFLLLAPWPYADLYPELKPFIIEQDYSKYNFVEPVIKPRQMEVEELAQAVLKCYKEYYLERIETYPAIRDRFKREYMLRSLQVMINNSFLRRHMQREGLLPAAMQKALELLESGI